MLPVLMPDEMAAVDAAAPDPVEVLIGRAGAAVARQAVDMLGGSYGRRVVVVAGKGNNGNDGREAARRLARRGVRVHLVAAADAADRLPPCDLVVDAAYGADLLVHEATFCEDEAARAQETEHSTALEAARVARDSEVRLLALTHSSSRYSGGDLEREARTVFADTVVPRDFDLIEVPFPERGSPELVKRGARLPRAEVPSGS